MTTISVGGPAPYDVVVGVDVLGAVADALPGASQVAVVHPARLGALAQRIAGLFGDRAVTVIEVPDGEDAKRVEVASRCWDTLGAAGFTRSDAVVGVGGGATTDLAGWVAAAWLRGVRVVQVPTTLLGMVDAAIGGKTAVDTAAGKNLVGAFHPPAAVVADVTTLATLPAADFAAGLAEVVKAGFIADPEILRLVEADPLAALDPASPAVAELIERSVKVKADVVGEDLSEKGLREILNYGHTLGHAIEKAEHYSWRHGEAVSVGLVYAAELGRLAGRLDDATAARHSSVLESLGLPTRYEGDWPTLRDAMRVDKKARGSTLRFIVLDGLARPGVLAGPDDELLEKAYEVVTP